MGRVDGKVTLITGAARGQGRSHALKLAGEGASLILIDICDDIATARYSLSSLDDLRHTFELVQGYGAKAVMRQCDVRDLPSLKEAVDAGVQELGGLDVVCANAGICPLGTEQPPQAFVDVVDVNLGGVLNTVSASVSHLRKGASIILIGSVAGLIRGGGTEVRGAGGAGYSFAKRTIVELVGDLARVMAPQFIRVNAIHPTNTNTAMLHSEDMYRVFRPDLEAPTREDAEVAFPAMNAMPIGYVEPSDISEAVLFLAAEESRYVTGQNLAVDAGAVLKNFSAPSRRSSGS